MGPELHRVLSCIRLCPGTTMLRLERRELDFVPGQYLALALPDQTAFREYTIFSSISDPWLEFLVREVGGVSRRLAALTPGQEVLVDGPLGFFTLNEQPGPESPAGPKLLIANGVGIAGLHSMVASWPGLDYLAVHGVRFATELYGRPDFAPDRHIACLSADPATDGWHGRITAWLDNGQAASTLTKRWGTEWSATTECWLAGSSEMIHDVFDRLRGLGVAPEQLRTEVFF